MNYDRLAQEYIQNIRTSRITLNNTINIINQQDRAFRNILDVYNHRELDNRRSSRGYSTGARYPSIIPRLSTAFLNDIDDLLTPVVVRPTQRQITNATRDVQFGDISNPLNITCPITQQRFIDSDNVTQLISCNHIFTRDSLQHWFRTSVHCPMCRHDIRENGSDYTSPIGNNTPRTVPNEDTSDDEDADAGTDTDANTNADANTNTDTTTNNNPYSNYLNMTDLSGSRFSELVRRTLAGMSDASNSIVLEYTFLIPDISNNITVPV